ncbi:DUF4218 domain-containing protein [Camponotus japonicus]
MNRKRPRKDFSCLSKRHLRRLRAQESELICDSLLNTNVSHSDNDEHSEYLENDSIINSHIIDKRNETLVIENNECLPLNESDSEESAVSISSESISYSESISIASENANKTDNDFKNSLAIWATKHQISHTALRALLQRLKHSCFSKLSLDARSLLHTPRKQEIRIVTPGTYYHFGLLNSLLHILTSVKDNIDCVKISINVDGLPLSKSSSQQFWPILGSAI